MANLPPLDWPHAPYYAGLLIFGAAAFALQQWADRRDHRQKAALVRPKLAAQRCRRCGGPLGDWDGRFLSGDVHFHPGGYVPRVCVTCTTCRAEQVFYVFWECCGPERGISGVDCRLYNRDGLFEGVPTDRRDS